mmetsp:Transcript_100140/g.283534  ORF Transcript_100140/g.283534 Transcript_100140/m.283534 type:complete len:109 (-) Transcript_100140:524-850(-)
MLCRQSVVGNSGLGSVHGIVVVVVDEVEDVRLVVVVVFVLVEVEVVVVMLVKVRVVVEVVLVVFVRDVVKVRVVVVVVKSQAVQSEQMAHWQICDHPPLFADIWSHWS